MIYVLGEGFHRMASNITLLRLNLSDNEELILEFFDEKISRVGVNRGRPFIDNFITLTFYTIFEQKRLKLLEDEFCRLISSLSDFTLRLSQSKDPFNVSLDELYYDLLNIDFPCILDEKLYVKLTLLIKILACIYLKLERRYALDFNSFCKFISNFMINEGIKLYSEYQLFKDKSYEFGHLLQLNVKNIYDYTTLITALKTLPLIDFKGSRILVFYLTHVIGILSECNFKNFDTPIDSHIVRVLRRMGFIKHFRASHIREGSTIFKEIQYLARQVFPEDPMKFYYLRYVGEVFCKVSTPKCDECWLFSLCKTFFKT